jgi:hypothetical protein
MRLQKSDELGGYKMVYCINHPRRRASSWGGHIHFGKKEVFIGACEFCSRRIFSCKNSSGCYGKMK